MKSERLFFDNGRGEKLAARLDLPVDGMPEAYALFAHCFTCSKNLKAVGNISQALVMEKIAVLRFDFTGLGESAGEFADTNFSSNVEDLIAAANFLKENHGGPEILIGHSLGGAAVLQAAGAIETCKAVCTIGAPADPDHVTHLLASKRAEIEAEGQARVILAGRQFTIKKQFLDDLEMSGMERKIHQLKRSLLIFHSPVDNIVGIENAGKIYEFAQHPKSFVSLDRADHLLSDERDSRYVGTVLAAWAGKYIDAGKKTEALSLQPEADKVVVRTAEGYYTEIMANGHPLLADEPVSVGGTNLGPSPYELLSAALGACTTLTLRMYADRKQWPAEAITVRVRHGKIHAKDCGECETSSGKIDQFRKEIEITGPLDDTQRNRMLEIADRCPVHRTLHNEVKIESRLKK